MNTRLYMITAIALLFMAGTASAVGDMSLNGPPVRDVSDVAVNPESGLTEPGTFITVELAESGNDCSSCHPNWEADMLAGTPHTSTAEKPTTCNDCHYTADKAMNMGYTACEGNVINPKRLLLQRQSKSCAGENCHDQQVEELASGKMNDYVSCLACHDPYEMEPDTTGHAFGLSKEVENGDELCQPCHSLKAGDASELSVIHYGIARMEKGLSADVAGISNVTPACFDCHQLQDRVDGVDIKNHNFGFELERSNKSCLVQGCHPDKEYDWVADQVHRWQDMKASVEYEIEEVLFPEPPAVLTVGPVRATFYGGILALLLVAAITIVKYQRRDEQ